MGFVWTAKENVPVICRGMCSGFVLLSSWNSEMYVRALIKASAKMIPAANSKSPPYPQHHLTTYLRAPFRLPGSLD